MKRTGKRTGLYVVWIVLSETLCLCLPVFARLELETRMAACGGSFASRRDGMFGMFLRLKGGGYILFCLVSYILQQYLFNPKPF